MEDGQMDQNQKEDTMYFEGGFPIPDTGLELRNSEAWIIDERGRVRYGVVQLSNGREHYVTLDFRVVKDNEMFRTRAEAMKAARKFKKMKS